MTQQSAPTDTWAPDACTLPTADRPVRLAQFDTLFDNDVTDVHRSAPDRALLTLRTDPATAVRVADLCVRETACCSFFEFTLAATGGHLTLTVATPPEHRAVLDAFVKRAAGAVR
jgi:hypothetical protein